jgi:hypothetical protein
MFPERIKLTHEKHNSKNFGEEDPLLALKKDTSKDILLLTTRSP